MSEEHSTEWDNTTVTCLGSFETEIHNLIKDSIMFNAGTTNKQKLNEYMSDMFVEDVCEYMPCSSHGLYANDERHGPSKRSDEK